MLGSLLLRVLFVPAMVGSGNPRLIWAGMLLPQSLMLFAAAVWLVAPIAIWKAFGAWWMLLWLVPSGAAVFELAFAPKGGG